MSLLDDVSIVVTPNGYKAGELYAVVPVPTEGAELVTNGDFSGGSTGWTLGLGWNISSERLNINTNDGDASATQSGVLVIGKRYKMTLTSNITGTIKFESGEGTDFLITSTDNSVTHYFIADKTQLKFRRYSAPTTGYLDNVSVKEYTAADMDVTRATAATRVDEDGLVNYAKILGDELVPDGNFTNQAAVDYWQIASSRATKSLEDGFMRLTYDVAVGSALYKNNLATAGNDYLVTFRAKGTASSNFSAIGENSSVGNNPINPVLTSDWQDYKFIVPLSGITFRFYLSSAQIGETLDITNISVKEITRDNVPRIDYTGGGCPHILAEPQRTNLITYSVDFSQWIIQSGITITTNTTDTLSPSGLNDASKVVSTDNTKGFYLIPASTTSDVTRTIYLKGSVGGESVTLKDGGGFGGTVTHTLTTEWARYEFKTTNDGNTYKGLYVDDISVGTIYVWGAQFEEGSYATSYIPNFGTLLGVTRNQDIFTRDGIGSLINSTEGVLFVEMAALSDDETNREITLSDGTGSNYVLIRFNSGGSNRIYTRVDVGGGNEYYDLDTSHTITDVNKIAIRWDDSNFATFINGVKVGSQLSGSSFSADTLNELNFDNGTGANNFNGKVKQLQVYKTALSPTQLAALTS